MAYNCWCPNSEGRQGCQFCNNKTGDLQMDEVSEEMVCPHDNEIKIKVMGETVSGLIAPKMTKAAIKADRKKRSTAHFKKDVLPTLGRDEKRHFGKKYGGT